MKQHHPTSPQNKKFKTTHSAGKDMFLKSQNSCYTAQILLPQISTSLEHSKMPSVRKSSGVMTRLLKKWHRVQNSNSYKGTDTLVVPWLLKAVEFEEECVEELGV
jgi:hypothetical protein